MLELYNIQGLKVNLKVYDTNVSNKAQIIFGC